MTNPQDEQNNPAKAIKETCLRLLARREHSRKELLTKLLQKGFSKDDISPVLDELKEQGWQSDERYAENYTRHRLHKGYGATAISYALKQNGVDVQDLDAQLETVADSWQEHLAKVYHKKYDHDSNLSPAEWAKRCRFLLQRGFTGAQINALKRQLKI